jgi:hypothetical protein
MTIEGINPEGPVATGKASIPTPMVVPAISKVPPTTCPMEWIILIKAPILWLSIITVLLENENLKNIFSWRKF